MIKFIQHIPSFCTGYEPYEIEAETIADLLKHERLAEHATNKDFYKFSWSKNKYEQSKAHLMLELKNGEQWWVLGSMDYIPKESELPEWRCPK